MLEQLGYDLMEAVFEVCNEIGYGVVEEFYQQSLEIELRLRGIPVASRPELRLCYKSEPINKRYAPDFFVFDAIVVELKAVQELISDHEAQLFNDMRIARLQVGNLINFGWKGGIQWTRFVLSDLK
ncbi:MAG: GxxExxY protein [Planctomycetaceae bacterium]